MTKDEANIKSKEVFDWFCYQCKLIETQAKEDGLWQTVGLDSNQHLFKPLMAEVKRKLAIIRESVDED